MMGSVEVVFGEACYSIFDAFLSMPVELANGRLWHIPDVRKPLRLGLETGARRAFTACGSSSRICE